MSLLNTIIHMDKTQRNYKRFMHVVGVMSRYGFESLSAIESKNKILSFILSRRKKKPLEPLAVRFRLMLQELGPTYVKLGQILSTRHDLLPKSFIDSLSKLQEQVEPMPYEKVEEVIVSELGGPISDFFVTIERTPIGAASIGQAHKATLKNGEEVIVKVQRPGILHSIEADLEIMRYIAHRMTLMSKELALLHPEDVISEFARALMQELDYQNEAANLRHFAQVIHNDKGISTPKVYEDFCTSKVLVMELVRGVSASKLMKDKDLRVDYDLEMIATNAANSIFSQILLEGFFHADPHPGNIIIGDDNTLTFIDLGMTGNITIQERQTFVRAIQMMLKHDYKQLTIQLLKLCKWDPNIDADGLTRDLTAFLSANLYREPRHISLGKVLEEILSLVRIYHLTLSPNLYLMFKALITVESLVKTFHPNLDFIGMMRPFVRRLKLRAYYPRQYIEQVVDQLPDMVNAATDMPRLVHTIMERVSEGKASIQLEHKGLDNLQTTLKAVSERIAFAIVLAALLIGSSLIVLAKVPPYIAEDLSLFGFLGYLFAGVLGFLMLVDFLKDRKK